MLQGRSNASLRKVVQRAIEAAGVASWPRLWHNLRGTRQNELLEAGFNRKAVCCWLGNNAETASERGLLARRGVAVDHALGDGSVERPDRLRDAGALLGPLGCARFFHG
jgi:hypothetical protein